MRRRFFARVLLIFSLLPRLQAMNLYAKAGTPVMAVRLAKGNGRDKDLLRYALDCNATIQLDTARYFEGKGMIDEAVQLYQRGKQAGRALELALSRGCAHPCEPHRIA